MKWQKLVALCLFAAIAWSSAEADSTETPGDILLGHVSELIEIAEANRDDCDKMGVEMERFFNGHSSEFEESVAELKEASTEEMRRFVEEAEIQIQLLIDLAAGCGGENELVSSVVLNYLFVTLAIAEILENESPAPESPEDRLLAHLEKFTEIAEVNKDDCDKMGAEMEEYITQNEEDLDETFTTLEQLSTEDKLRLAESLQKPIERLIEAIGPCSDMNDTVSAVGMIFTFLLIALANEEGTESNIEEVKRGDEDPRVEAHTEVHKIAMGAEAHFWKDQYDENGYPVSLDKKTFPKTEKPVTTHSTGVPKGEQVPPDADFSQQVWNDLSYSHAGPMYYRITYTMGGEGTDSWCEIVAEGDLDGDGETSKYTRRVTVDSEGEPEVSDMMEENPDE